MIVTIEHKRFRPTFSEVIDCTVVYVNGVAISTFEGHLRSDVIELVKALNPDAEIELRRL